MASLSAPTFEYWPSPRIFMKKQVCVYYSGQMQGIGFRFTAERLAEELGVLGWVSNLSDGRVELVAEANEDALKNFLAQLNNIFKRYIQDVNINWKSATGEFKDFGIKF